MARSDIGHRDIAFSTLLNGLGDGLKRISDAPEHDVLFLGGGGTAATEAVLSTFVAAGERILVVSNGAFGERLVEIATILGLEVAHLRYEWGFSIPLNEIDQALTADRSIHNVAMVHHETSTGQLNPVKAAGTICAWHKARLIVDTVSGLGAEEFSASSVQAAIVIGSPNKCLHGVPGASFVLVRNDCWAEAERIAPRSMFLDLRRYRVAAKASSQTPFTPPVHALVALNEAIRELEDEGGPAARRARYLGLNAQLRQGLANLGLRARFDASHAGASVIVAELPQSRSSAGFHAALRGRGFVVYECKNALRENSFIVSNMGSLDSITIEAFLDAVAEEIKSQDRPAAIASS